MARLSSSPGCTKPKVRIVAKPLPTWALHADSVSLELTAGDQVVTKWITGLTDAARSGRAIRPALLDRWRHFSEI